MSVRQIMLTLLRLNTESRGHGGGLSEKTLHSVSSVHSVLKILTTARTHKLKNSQTHKLKNLKT